MENTEIAERCKRNLHPRSKFLSMGAETSESRDYETPTMSCRERCAIPTCATSTYLRSLLPAVADRCRPVCGAEVAVVEVLFGSEASRLVSSSSAAIQSSASCPSRAPRSM